MHIGTTNMSSICIIIMNRTHIASTATMASLHRCQIRHYSIRKNSLVSDIYDCAIKNVKIAVNE